MKLPIIYQSLLGIMYQADYLPMGFTSKLTTVMLRLCHRLFSQRIIDYELMPEWLSRQPHEEFL